MSEWLLNEIRNLGIASTYIQRLVRYELRDYLESYELDNEEVSCHKEVRLFMESQAEGYAFKDFLLEQMKNELNRLPLPESPDSWIEEACRRHLEKYVRLEGRSLHLNGKVMTLKEKERDLIHFFIESFKKGILYHTSKEVVYAVEGKRRIGEKYKQSIRKNYFNDDKDKFKALFKKHHTQAMYALNIPDLPPFELALIK